MKTFLAPLFLAVALLVGSRGLASSTTPDRSRRTT